MTYERGQATDYREIDRWESGVGWLAHPEEAGQRASHAVCTAEGCWLLDPLWAPGIEDRLEDLPEPVVGVAVCSAWHARDADRFARIYDVPVFVPEWMGRVPERVDAPLERYRGDLADSIRLERCEPMPGWSEAMLFWEDHETLYVPDSIGTIEAFTVGEERLGLELVRRLSPPRQLRTLEPERVLVGHGEGILDDATRALEYALADQTRRFPRALLENGPASVRSIVDAVRE
ncbi:hypothetical protein D8Y22_15285 [Salinadaptatus halalkaliphilus]|uniref:MBL fold metallo-hydrolase n=1 Tax=Salinadaptatus halalkaliphilus TaxID=2419781 RepID=A0A4S3TK85_9EURY|nr:hypothetical protein [Salinadaptatus halalkaliphilus]THE63970.1 hypothetical protein D8Y22_15285 [Salinadaptatus halalkaliphilus]